MTTQDWESELPPITPGPYEPPAPLPQEGFTVTGGARDGEWCCVVAPSGAVWSAWPKAQQAADAAGRYARATGQRLLLPHDAFGRSGFWFLRGAGR